MSLKQTPTQYDSYSVNSNYSFPKQWNQRTVSQREDFKQDTPRKQLLAFVASLKGELDNIRDGTTSLVDIPDKVSTMEQKLHYMEEILTEFVLEDKVR